MIMNDILKNLPPDTTLRPEAGSFRSRLVEITLEKGDEDFAELFSENTCDIIVSLAGRTIEDALIRFRVISDEGEQSLKIPVSALSKEELYDFTEQLSRQSAQPGIPVPRDNSKVIFRKKAVEGMLDIQLASQKLGCTPQFLKSKIPCSDYTYTEIEGKKEIQGYYWKPELMDRLHQIKVQGVKPDDLKYIADECCDGDRVWAEEIQALLSTPKNNPKTMSQPSTQTPHKQPSKNGAKEHHRPPRKRQP